jgi:two-component system, LytTR family, sensor kinase
MVSKKVITVFYHLLFWGCLWMVPMVLIPIVEPWENDWEFQELGIVRLSYMFLLTGTFYFNLFILYPKFLVPKKPAAYIFFALLTAITIGVVYCFVFYEHIEGPIIIHILLKMIMTLVFIACSTVLKVIQTSMNEQRLKQQKETENLRTELSFLRSQISPHFMFNVLNSIVALIRQKSDKLESVVIELSNLMRYMLYESDEESVSLRTEIDYLKSYIDLQMQRFGEDIRVHTSIPTEIPDRYLEPMLLIPLVENAFKHGYGIMNDSEISIDLKFSDSTLSMEVRNKFVQKRPEVNTRNSGIGLKNLKRRLNLMYPDLHQLEVQTRGDWFIVLFTLKFKDAVRPLLKSGAPEGAYA